MSSGTSQIKTIGIVGAERAKFSASQIFVVRRLIRSLIAPYDVVVSGACHLGGVDEWAARVGHECGKGVTEFPPKTKSWESYKARNIEIVMLADRVVSIVVRRLPLGFKGMKHRLCYHCKTDDHVKSGGCWTAWKALEWGKTAELIIVGDRIAHHRELIKK
jgi:hypothetical protein